MALKLLRLHAWTGALLFGAALLLGWAAWQLTGPRDADSDGGGSVTTATPAATVVAAQAGEPASGQTSVLPAALPAARAADPIGAAANLKGVFDQYIDGADVSQRRIAARAYEACVPAFLPASGQTPSPDPLIGALPAELRAEREAAYRSIYARCSGFLGLGRGELATLHRRLEADPQLREPGARARDELAAGNIEQALSLAADVLNGGDPAAVASLAGLAERLTQRRAPDALDAGALAGSRAVDAALPLLACELGLDCSINSLSALQMCAAEGLCEGDASARLLQRAAADGIDRAAVAEQRTRLLALVRSGKALSAAELISTPAGDRPPR